MPALVAVIRPKERLVMLDPAVMAGDLVKHRNGDQIRLLGVTATGHLAEHAHFVAKTLRSAGWQVQIRDCEALRPRPAEHRARTVEQVSIQSAALARQVLAAAEPRRRTKRDTSRWIRYRCDICGLISLPGGMATHQKGSGHQGRTQVTPDSPVG